MLLLASTSDVLSLVTGEAATIDVQASYNDHNGAVVTPGRLNTAIASATTTAVVAAPGASVQRSLRGLRIRNTHATLSCRVTIRHTDGTTAVDVYSAMLVPSAILQYTDAAGFLCTPPCGPPVAMHLFAGFFPVDTEALKLVPWSIPMVPGTYVLDADILHQTVENSGAGMRLSFAHSGTVTTFVWDAEFVDTAASASAAQPDQNEIPPGGTLMCHFSSRAGSTTVRGMTLNVDTIAAALYLRVHGIIVCTVAGDLQVWFGTEVANYTAQLLPDSVITLTQVA
jgi:hypothetical protein